MKEKKSIFKKFSNLAKASELKELLLSNGIESEISDNSPPVDIAFSGNTVNNVFEVRIMQSDFSKAENVLTKDAENLINEIDQDYYLFDFSNEELYEIILKADEWNTFDYTLAQKILKDRNKPIDKDLLKSLKKERLRDLASPEGSQTPWILAGYIMTLLGGFLGLIIGYFLWTAKKTLPDGQRVYTYSEKDRKHGKYMFFLGLVMLPFAIYIRTLSNS